MAPHRREGSTDTKKRREQLALQIEEIELRSKTLKLRREMSQLVDREAALTATRQQNLIIRAELESIPGRLASVFPPEYRDVLAAELEQQVYLILKKFNLNETSDDPPAATTS